MIFLLITGITACSLKNEKNSDHSRQSVESSESEAPVPAIDKEQNQSADSPESTDNKSQAPDDPLKTDQLTIDYFDWDVREKIIEKALCYTLTLKNRSPYPILSTEIRYKTKENVSDKSLKLFDEFKNSHKKYIQAEEDNRDIILIGSSEAYVKSGQYLLDVPVTIGIHSMTWYDTPDYDQFILMRPDELSLGLVKNDLLYSCHYDFLSNTWSVDENPVRVNEWPDHPLTKLVPKPSCDFFRITTDPDRDYLVFTVYGYSEDAYNSYVESVREAGFTKKSHKGKSYYSAEDKKDNSIDIMYDKSNWNMEVSVNL